MSGLSEMKSIAERILFIAMSCDSVIKILCVLNFRIADYLNINCEQTDKTFKIYSLHVRNIFMGNNNS